MIVCIVVNGEKFQSQCNLELERINIDYLMVGLRYGFYPRVTRVISYQSRVDKTTSQKQP